MKHLKEIDETYWQHFRVASKIAFKAFIGSVIIFLHAICPCIFEETGGKLLKEALKTKESRE